MISTPQTGAFLTDSQQWLLDPRRRARPFRSATAGSPRHDRRLRGSVRADSGCELAPGRAPLLRLVSRSKRSRSAALRCEHGWLSRRVASGPRKPKSGRRIHPRIPFVARRNDASRSGTLQRNPTSECKLKINSIRATLSIKTLSARNGNA